MAATGSEGCPDTEGMGNTGDLPSLSPLETWELVKKITVAAYWGIQLFEVGLRYYQGQGCTLSEKTGPLEYNNQLCKCH